MDAELQFRRERNTIGGTRTLIVLLLAQTMLLWTSEVHGQVKHWSIGKEDQLSECFGRILKRRVLLNYVLPKTDPSVCDGATAEEVRLRLKKNSYGFILNDEWAYLTDAGPREGEKEWRLVVQPSLSADDLPKNEQEALLAVLTDHARLLPIWYSRNSDLPDGPRTVWIQLRYRAHVMPGIPGTARLVVVLRQSAQLSPCRLIFVEKHHGQFVVKWDTGELDAASVGVEFDDLFGDGKQEIVAMGEVGVDPDPDSKVVQPKPITHDVLAVFDTEGRELTRQEPCGSVAHGRAAGMVCPIEGAEISFITGENPWQIEVTRNASAAGETTSFFRFAKETGRYVATGPGKSSE